METLHFDLTKEGRPIKLMNCTNGGPLGLFAGIKKKASHPPGCEAFVFDGSNKNQSIFTLGLYFSK